MHDLKFWDALNIAADFDSIPSAVVNSQIKQVAEAFSANLSRIRALASIPTLVHAIASLDERTEFVGFMGRLIEEGIITFPSESKRDECKQFIDKTFALPPALTNAQAVYQSSADRVDAIVKNERTWGGFFAILGAQVTGSWTAFETLATDLWIAAVNARPKTLGALLAGKSPPGAETEADPDSSGKTVPLEAVMKYEFDLREHMGDALAGKFTFTKIRDMSRAYKMAFGKDAKITDIFYGKELGSLNATRNVLIHRAGIADQEFCKRVKGHQLLSLTPEGELVQLTGSIAASLSAAAVLGARQLLSEVDGWLSAHPD